MAFCRFLRFSFSFLFSFFLLLPLSILDHLFSLLFHPPSLSYHPFLYINSVYFSAFLVYWNKCSDVAKSATIKDELLTLNNFFLTLYKSVVESSCIVHPFFPSTYPLLFLLLLLSTKTGQNSTGDEMRASHSKVSSANGEFSIDGS